MSAHVFIMDHARSRKWRELIDRVMADKPKKQRREFLYHVEVAVLIRQAIYDPLHAGRAAQREFLSDTARAVRKLTLAAGTESDLYPRWELIREHLYLNARQAGTPHAEASTQAATLIAALDALARNAPAIADACEAGARRPRSKNTPTDVLIRDFAYFFAEDFRTRPSATRNGQFAKLIQEFIGGKRIGADRLRRLIGACHLTAEPPKPGRKMPSRH